MMNLFKLVIIFYASELMIISALPLKNDGQSASESSNPNQRSTDQQGEVEDLQAETGPSPAAAPKKKSWADWKDESSSSHSDKPFIEAPSLKTTEQITHNRPTEQASEPKKILQDTDRLSTTSEILSRTDVAEMKRSHTTNPVDRLFSETPKPYFKLTQPPGAREHQTSNTRRDRTTPMSKMSLVPFRKNPEKEDSPSDTSSPSTPDRKTLSWADIARVKRMDATSQDSPTMEKQYSETDPHNVEQLSHLAEKEALQRNGAQEKLQSPKILEVLPQATLNETDGKVSDQAKPISVERARELRVAGEKAEGHSTTAPKKISWADWAEKESSDSDFEEMPFFKTSEQTPSKAEAGNTPAEQVAKQEKRDRGTGATLPSTSWADITKTKSLDKASADPQTIDRQHSETVPCDIKQIPNPVEDKASQQDGAQDNLQSSKTTGVLPSVLLKETIQEISDHTRKSSVEHFSEPQITEKNADRLSTTAPKKISWADWAERESSDSDFEEMPFFKTFKQTPSKSDTEKISVEQTNKQEKKQRGTGATLPPTSWADITKGKSLDKTNSESPAMEKQYSEIVPHNVKQISHNTKNEASQHDSAQENLQSSNTTEVLPPVSLKETIGMVSDHQAQPLSGEGASKLQIGGQNAEGPSTTASKKLSWADWAEMEDSDLDFEEMPFFKTFKQTRPKLDAEKIPAKQARVPEKRQWGTGTISRFPSTSWADITRGKSLDKTSSNTQSMEGQYSEAVSRNIKQVSPPIENRASNNYGAQENIQSPILNDGLPIIKTGKVISSQVRKKPVEKINELGKTQQNVHQLSTQIPERLPSAWAKTKSSRSGHYGPQRRMPVSKKSEQTPSQAKVQNKPVDQANKQKEVKLDTNRSSITAFKESLGTNVAKVKSLDRKSVKQLTEMSFLEAVKHNLVESQPVEDHTAQENIPLEASRVSKTPDRKSSYVPPFRRSKTSYSAEKRPVEQADKQEKIKQDTDSPSTTPAEQSRADVAEDESLATIDSENKEVVEKPFSKITLSVERISQPAPATPVEHYNTQEGLQFGTSKVGTIPTEMLSRANIPELEGLDVVKKLFPQTIEDNTAQISELEENNKPVQHDLQKDIHSDELSSDRPLSESVVKQIFHQDDTKPLEPADKHQGESQSDNGRTSTSGSIELSLAEVGKAESPSSDYVELPIQKPPSETIREADQQVTNFAEGKSEELSDMQESIESDTNRLLTATPVLPVSNLNEAINQSSKSSEPLAQTISSETLKYNIDSTTLSSSFQTDDHQMVSHPLFFRTDTTEPLPQTKSSAEIDYEIPQSALSTTDIPEQIALPMLPEIESIKHTSQPSSSKIEKDEQVVLLSSSPKEDSVTKMSESMSFKKDFDKQSSQPTSSKVKGSQSAATSERKEKKVFPLLKSFRDIVTGVTEEPRRVSRTEQKRNKQKTKREVKKQLHSKATEDYTSSPETLDEEPREGEEIHLHQTPTPLQEDIEKIDLPEALVPPQKDDKDGITSTKSNEETEEKSEPEDVPQPHTLTQIPKTTLFLKCPSKEVADEIIENCISEFQELYNEPTSSPLHVVIIRNMPQGINERKLKLKMIDKYKDVPKKIRIISSNANQKKNVLLQISDSLLNRIRNSPEIHLQRSQYTIDICSIIDQSDELSNSKQSHQPQKSFKYKETHQAQEINQPQKSQYPPKIHKPIETSKYQKTTQFSPTSKPDSPEEPETMHEMSKTAHWKMQQKKKKEEFFDEMLTHIRHSVPNLSEKDQTRGSSSNIGAEMKGILGPQPKQISQSKKVTQSQKSSKLEEIQQVQEISKSQGIPQSQKIETPQPQQTPHFEEISLSQKSVKHEEITHPQQISHPQRIQTPLPQQIPQFGEKKSQSQEILQPQNVQTSEPLPISQSKEISQLQKSVKQEETAQTQVISQPQKVMQPEKVLASQLKPILKLEEKTQTSTSLKHEKTPQVQGTSQPLKSLQPQKIHQPTEMKIAQSQEASQSPKSPNPNSPKESLTLYEISRTARRRLRQKKKKEELDEMLSHMLYTDPFFLEKNKASGSSSNVGDTELESNTNKRQSFPSENLQKSETGQKERGTPSNLPNIFEFTIGKHKLLIKSNDLGDNVSTTKEPEILLRLPSTTLFLKYPSQEVADDLQGCVSEFEELYDESTSSPSHVVVIRNLPQDITERKLKFKLINKYKDVPRKIQIISSSTDQKKNALIQVSDSLLDTMKESPDIHLQQSDHTIDICTIIDCGDELSNSSTERSKDGGSKDGGHSHSEENVLSTDRSVEKGKQKVGQEQMTEENTPFESQNAVNSLLDTTRAKKWKADVAEWDNVGEMLDSNHEILSRGERLIVLPKVSGDNVFTELEKFVLHPHKFGVNRTLLFASNVALVDCHSEADAMKLREVIRRSEKLTAYLTNIFIYEVWVHHLPLNASVDDITRAILRQYRENPRHVQLIPYKEKPNEQLARITVSETLLNEMRFSPKILIRKKQEGFTCPIQIKHCTNCGLFGHRREMCPLPTLHGDF